MQEGTKQLIIGLIGGLLIILIIVGGVYAYRKIEIDNFQATIKELSEEQKCVYICGFEFNSYHESYKFCIEKCDRISERYQTNDN